VVAVSRSMAVLSENSRGLRCRRKVLKVDAVWMVTGTLFQIWAAVELNAQLTNTVFVCWLGQQLVVRWSELTWR